MRKDRLVSALLGWLMFGFTLAFAQPSPFGNNPFGPQEEQYLIKNSFNKEFDLSKIGQFGREETMASFEKIWQQFRKTHQLTPDGTFYETESSTTPDSLQSKACFYVHVKKSTPEVVILDKQRCPQCSGKGRYYSVSYMTDVDCDTCATKGTLANRFTYRLTHTAKLPEGLSKYLPAENKPTSPPAASREPAGTSRPSPESRARVAYGSGMVFTKEGHIFTNHHVIENAARIYVVAFDNGQMVSKVEARIVKKDPRTDLAILQCNDWKPAAGAPSEPPPVVPSSQCKLGAEVFVLGYPLPGTVSSNVKYTKGDVSDLAGLDDDSSKIQHTAPIQPGNSGGPMALKDGRIVGVIVSSLDEGYALKKSGAFPQGVNFSVKTDYLLTLCSIAGIELPKSTPSAEPVEHVRAYTVQIMSEK